MARRARLVEEGSSKGARCAEEGRWHGELCERRRRPSSVEWGPHDSELGRRVRERRAREKGRFACWFLHPLKTK